IDSTQAELTRLSDQFASNGEILVLHFVRVGNDFLDREFLSSLGDQQVLLGEIFRSEYLVERAILNQKAAACDLGSRCCGKRRHISPLFENCQIMGLRVSDPSNTCSGALVSGLCPSHFWEGYRENRRIAGTCSARVGSGKTPADRARQP